MTARFLPFGSKLGGQGRSGDAGSGGTRLTRRRSKWIPERARPTYRELYPEPFSREESRKALERRIADKLANL